MNNENLKKCILIVSHSNFLIKSGGVEKFLRDYSEILIRNNIHYINMFPVIEINKKLKLLKKEYVAIFFDGEFKGIWSEYKLNEAIYKITREERCEIDCIQIHHFYGWNSDALNAALRVLNRPIVVFIHDLQIICPSMFRRNANKACMQIVPMIGDSICNECLYEEYDRHIFKDICTFLTGISSNLKKIYVPSNNTKNHFLKVFPQFKNITFIREHLQYSLEHHLISQNDKIRIAYLGSTANHKGYNEWKELLGKISNDIYEFYYFGSDNVDDRMVKCVKVDARNTTIKSMTEQLTAYNIDISFLWSKCQETYCYTYYEASESGTFILTNINSGNICDQVYSKRNGKVFNSILECILFLNNTNLVKNCLKEFCENNLIPTNVKINDDISDCIEAQDFLGLEYALEKQDDKKHYFACRNLPLSFLYKIMRG